MTCARGTTNTNCRGSAADRAKRRALVVARDGWPEHGIVLCARCGVPLLQDEDPEAPGQSMTLDRITPGCEGGKYDLDSIRAYCRPCNQETGGRLGAERKRLRRLGLLPPKAGTENGTVQPALLPDVPDGDDRPGRDQDQGRSDTVQGRGL